MRAPWPALRRPCNALCVAVDHDTAQKSCEQAKCVTVTGCAAPGPTPCTRSASASLRHAHDAYCFAKAKALRRANAVNDRKSMNSAWAPGTAHTSVSTAPALPSCPGTEHTTCPMAIAWQVFVLWHRRVLHMRITPIATPTESAPCLVGLHCLRNGNCTTRLVH